MGLKAKPKEIQKKRKNKEKRTHMVGPFAEGNKWKIEMKRLLSTH